ncbi:hypothetical protein F5051DRAFT_416036 [Lentinula edodes]|nr:hypothetical protein F5051DRAFT_416036 [Lentinula edodes]
MSDWYLCRVTKFLAFFGRTRFLVESPEVQTDHRMAVAEVPGILLEYVEGQRLDTFSADALSPTRCQKCVDVVLELGDRDVLNKDVHLENFIVSSNPGVFGSPNRCCKAVIIDFAQARLRWEDEDDEQWKRVKWSTDEEGTVGYVLQKKCGWAY